MNLSRDQLATAAAMTDSRQFVPCGGLDLYGRAIAAAGTDFMSAAAVAAAAASTAPSGYGCYFRRTPAATTANNYDRKSPSASFSSGDESCGSATSGVAGFNETGRHRGNHMEDAMLSGSMMTADQLMMHANQQDGGAGSDVGVDFDEENDRDRSGSSTGTGPKKHKAQKQVYGFCNLAVDLFNSVFMFAGRMTSFMQPLNELPT